VASAVLLWLAAWPGAASAHANLERSDPGDGAQLDAPPERISLTFTERPDPALSSIEVLDASGSAVAIGDLELDPGEPKTVSASVTSELPDGTYTVSWRVVSQEDGHTTAGAFAFGVGVAPSPGTTPPEVPTTPGVAPLAVVGKVLLYAGLAIVVAAAFVGLWALGGTVPARRVVLLGGGAAALLGALLLFAAEAETLGVSLGDLVGSATGALFVRLVVATAIAGVLSAIAALVPGWKTLVLAGAGAAAAMLIRADGGHAAASSNAWLQVGLQWIHFVAVGVWIGGLALVLGHVRARREAGPPIEAVRRYSRMAGWALATVLVTGAIRAGNELGGIGWWLRASDTSYGTTLVVKILVVSIVIALGAWNRYRSIPRLGERPGLLRRVMAIELVGAFGVFSLTGILTALPPQPPAAPPPAAPQRLVAEGRDFATTMRLRLTVSPGTPGPNRFDVRVAEYDSGEPLPVDRVALRFDSPSRPQLPTTQLELKASGDRWVADGTALSVPGVWTLTASVQRAAEGTEVPLVLVVEDPSQVDVVSTAPDQPDIHSIALSGGERIQVYLDPSEPGPGQVHFTAFDAQGAELPIDDLRIVAVPPEGAPIALSSDRFSPGHFVASVQLTEGDWTFVSVADTAAGESLTASFAQTVGRGVGSDA
jgi:copper transport protein